MSEMERLIKACEAMRDDLLMRADIDTDGTRAVNVSHSKWEEFNDAMDAANTWQARAQDQEEGGVRWIEGVEADVFTFTRTLNRCVSLIEAEQAKCGPGEIGDAVWMDGDIDTIKRLIGLVTDSAKNQGEAEPMEPRPLAVNRYGVDRDYFTKKLEIVIRDMSNYTRDELARSLARLVSVADKGVLNEPEFHPAQGREQWVKCSDRLPTEADGDWDGQVVVLDDYGKMGCTNWSVATRRIITHWMPTGLKRPNPPQPQSSGEDERGGISHERLDEAALRRVGHPLRQPSRRNAS